MSDTQPDGGSDDPKDVAQELVGNVNPLDPEGKEEMRQKVREQIHQQAQEDSREP